jgi:hypothetical protein
VDFFALRLAWEYRRFESELVEPGRRPFVACAKSGQQVHDGVLRENRAKIDQIVEPNERSVRQLFEIAEVARAALGASHELDSAM